MDSRERVVNTLKFREVDRLPRQLWNLPGVELFRNDELREVLEKYPEDINARFFSYAPGKRNKGSPALVGQYIDAWGCEWHVCEPGVVGEVKGYVLSDFSALKGYEPPWELLDQIDVSNINRICGNSEKFMLAGTEIRPFERMQFLRGTETLMMDLAYDNPEIYELRDKLHAFFVKEAETWAKTDVDGVSFMDDWGTQKSLLISPVIWREFYKPLYKDYCDILHARGKFAFMHSDGNIQAIYPDLVEIGVDAINSQLFCMDIEELGNRYSGKITFWGEIDRQHVLLFGDPGDVRSAVRRVAKALIKGAKTGVIAQCEWGINDPKENIEAVFDEWNKV